MRVTYYGHSTFRVEMNGKRLLFDPFITPNPKASFLAADKIQADYIFVSHGHEDHLYDVEAIAKAQGASIISNFEIVNWFEKKGVKGHPMNHGGKWRFDFGVVKFVNAIHSSVLPDGSNGGNPGGFVVWDGNSAFYFAGDTALTMDMKLIPMTCPKLDFAILPIGDNFTMDYNDAVIASDFIECDTIIGCHFNTFPYIEIDSDTAKQPFKVRGKNLILLNIGEAQEI